MNKNTISNESVDDLKKRLLNCNKEALVFPAVATEAVELTNDPSFSMAELACLVERDPKLTTELLSLANSPLFAGSSPVSSIHQSIVRLGVKQCRNMILSVCVSGMMKKISIDQEWMRSLLWRHSFMTASACLYLNRTFGLGFQGEEFTAGLLHDIGRTLFAVVDIENFEIADSLNINEGKSQLARETEVFGIDHCEFGAWFATNNQLPESLVEVIRWHHEPSQENPHQKLIALVAASDQVANQIHILEEPTDYDPKENVAVDILSELYNRNFTDKFCEIAPQLISDVRNMAGSDSDCEQEAV